MTDDQRKNGYGMIREQTIEKYCGDLYSRLPAPGGGGAAAVAGALAACLGGMVENFTLGKKKYAEYEEETVKALAETARIRDSFLRLADRDEEVFLPLSKAYGLPHETEEEQAEKDRIMEACLKDACEVPLEIMRELLALSECLSAMIGKTNRMVLSDIGVALALAHGAMESAALNVRINTRSMKDAEAATERNEECERLLSEEAKIYGTFFPEVREALK